MFIAHMPGGYLVTRVLHRAFAKERPLDARLVLLGLVASIAPDFDGFYFFLVDHGQVHRHRYFRFIKEEIQ